MQFIIKWDNTYEVPNTWHTVAFNKKGYYYCHYWNYGWHSFAIKRGTKVLICMFMLHIICPLINMSLASGRFITPHLWNACSRRWGPGSWWRIRKQGWLGLRWMLVVEDLKNTEEIIPTQPFSVYNRPSVKWQKELWCLSLEHFSTHN